MRNTNLHTKALTRDKLLFRILKFIYSTVAFIVISAASLQAQQFFLPMSSSITYELFAERGGNGNYIGYFESYTARSGAQSIIIYYSGAETRIYDLETSCDVIEVRTNGPACRAVPVLTAVHVEAISPSDPEFETCFNNPSTCWPEAPWGGGNWEPPLGGGSSVPDNIFFLDEVRIVEEKYEPEDICACEPLPNDYYTDSISIEVDTVYVDVWNPRLTWSGFLGHVSMTIHDTAYSFAMGGMERVDTGKYYGAQRKLRGGYRYIMEVPKSFIPDAKQFLGNFNQRYTFFINCGTPVALFFNRITTGPLILLQPPVPQDFMIFLPNLPEYRGYFYVPKNP